MKKVVHIIAHSHWDREWYLPYEHYHMKLVELIDNLLILFERDPNFHSFHLDGQTICLDDYLEVRPEKRDVLKKYIQTGKLRMGPFYILQDAFLVSSEANTRNMLIGMETSKKWGTPVKLGYFPDTFGNMGQTPQLMKQIGLDVAAFGRGVKTTGFNNTVVDDEKYASKFSEVWWEGPDGSKILGILFANWYSNGNEIPTEREAAKRFWDQKLQDAIKYASTDHLLMMNGCDHQPFQQDLSKAIKIANELYSNIEFIHTDFDTYLSAVKQDLPSHIGKVAGELTSQETDGWYTLANTASARIYLKQMNTEVSRLLENMTEPLATMAYEQASDYPHDQLRYAWKLYLQNHPHDSICGCSVDEVHREMVTRFEKAKEVGKYLAAKATEALANQIDTSNFPLTSKPFIVFNTAGSTKTGLVDIDIEWKRLPFTSGRPDKLYQQLKAETLPNFTVINQQGEPIQAEILKTETRFGYDLPKDKFRQPYMATYVTVRLLINEMPLLSWETFALIENKAPSITQEKIVTENGRMLENEFLQVLVDGNGQLTVTDKETKTIYPNLLTFENVGDIGNEYIFKQPENDQTILSTEYPATVEVLKNNELYGEILLTTKMEVPISADERLEEECRAVIEFRNRKAKRSSTKDILKLETKILLEKGSRQLKFTTSFHNKMKDHRLRVLFPTRINTDTHEADSIYEVVTRPNKVSSSWKNPTNAQHQHAFVNIHNSQQGVTVSNYGLNEYEILKPNNTIALTLLRAVGEMGDWGYFPTPEAQCLGNQRVKYGIAFHGAQDKLKTYHDAVNFQIPFTAYQTSSHKGQYPSQYQYLTLQGDAFNLTAFKRKEQSHELIIRGYNLTTERQHVKLTIPNLEPKRCNLLEEKQPTHPSNYMNPAEIISYLWEPIQ